SAAISAGSRCGGMCFSQTIAPSDYSVGYRRLTYLVGHSIIPYYYTQLIGDAKKPPTLLAAASFTDVAVIDADPYIPGGNGAQWCTNQNNLQVKKNDIYLPDSFRSIRNFVIDVTRGPATMTQGTGIHWQVAQATSLNIVFQMSTAANTAHQGIWMENGSGQHPETVSLSVS
ncbi:exo-beta-1,3-glucanase, partial [Mycena filopes]